MAKQYEIEVIGEEKEIKDTKQKFVAYNAYDKNNKKVTVKFVKEIKDKTPGVGRHVIVIDTDNANMDLTGRFPTLWVKDIIAVKEPEKKDTVSAYFD